MGIDKRPTIQAIRELTVSLLIQAEKNPNFVKNPKNGGKPARDRSATENAKVRGDRKMVWPFKNDISDQYTTERETGYSGPEILALETIANTIKLETKYAIK